MFSISELLCASLQGQGCDQQSFVGDGSSHPFQLRQSTVGPDQRAQNSIGFQGRLGREVMDGERTHRSPGNDDVELDLLKITLF